jgi:hypothetical protein
MSLNRNSCGGRPETRQTSTAIDPGQLAGGEFSAGDVDAEFPVEGLEASTAACRHPRGCRDTRARAKILPTRVDRGIVG